MSDVITEYRIARALKSGPPAIREGAKVVDMDADGTMTVLREGTNGWTCMPGVETASADMCADEMGMQWFMDIMASKPRPTNTSPGLIYMLNGAVQHSYTDPFDRTSPLIPIGPHWMLIWPFTAEHTGLSTVMRDAGDHDHVRRNAVRASAHLRGSVGGQRISPQRRGGVDHDLQAAAADQLLGHLGPRAKKQFSADLWVGVPARAS